MKKLIKLFKHPILFFKDAAKKKKLSEGKQKIFVVGFSTWKTYLRMYFSEYDLIFLPKDIKKSEFNSQYRKKIVYLKDTCQVFIWGFKAPEYILDFLREEKIATKFVEDGFVRSVQLGATKAPPMSLCLDSVTPYFDATKASELEVLLNTFDFKGKDELIERAKKGIELLCKTGVSKYNNSSPVDVAKLYGTKSKKRVLVLGQVEDDASIMFGCEKRITNNDVVRLAVSENPDAQVIYKPHPDVLNGHRHYQSNPREVSDICTLITKDIPLANAFESVDHVYTITSLGGFEAILRGIKVTTLGCPFYSGWGLTDDRQKNKRRNRILNIYQIFAISYLIYPKYFNVNSGESVSFEDVVDCIEDEKNKIIPHKETEIVKRDRGNPNRVKLDFIKVSIDEGGSSCRNRAFLIGFGMHKLRFYSEQFSKYVCYALNIPVSKQSDLTAEQILKSCSPKHGDAFIIWGKKEPAKFEQQARLLGIDVIRVEDAFIRSIGLGGHHATPLSYIFDKKGIYFDSNQSSDLEDILNSYDFKSDEVLMDNARGCIQRIVMSKTSKYNYAGDVDVANIYGEKKNKRILVIGQVEDDASILYGCSKVMTNNDLVILASLENPGAQIIYKPHPDVLTGLRKRRSDPSLIENIAYVLYDSVSISDALKTVDHVYTITSLTGFEALLRGIKVTTIGAPFYSGWGLTDDRQIVHRRTRTLSVEEVFAGAYILYTNYVNPFTKDGIDIVSALDTLEWMKETKVQPIDLLSSFSNSKAVISKINNELTEGNISGALVSADLAVGSYGDVESYLARARVKVSGGIVDASVKKDIVFAVNSSKWMDKKSLFQYAKYLWEFEGYDKELHKVASALERLDSLTLSEVKLLSAIFCDGGFFGRVRNLVTKYDLQNQDIGYLVLNSHIDRYIKSRNEQCSSSLELINSIISVTNEFERLVLSAPDSLCIVGNSPVELGKNKGKEIDSYKNVIRFNAYNVSYPFSRDYGTKTTVWVRMPKNMINLGLKQDSGLEMVIVSGSNWQSRMDDGLETFSCLVEQFKKVGVVPFSVYSRLVAELKSPPSAGLQILYWIYTLIGPIPKKNIFGFELTDQVHGRDKQYSNSTSRHVRHDWSNERALFDKIVNI